MNYLTMFADIQAAMPPATQTDGRVMETGFIHSASSVASLDRPMADTVSHLCTTPQRGSRIWLVKGGGVDETSKSDLQGSKA